jgi:hypothetical protein
LRANRGTYFEGPVVHAKVQDEHVSGAPACPQRLQQSRQAGQRRLECCGRSDGVHALKKKKEKKKKQAVFVFKKN